MMKKKNCLQCGKALRKCKFVDISDREYHFKCIEKIKQEKYEKELADFLQFFLSKGVVVRID